MVQILARLSVFIGSVDGSEEKVSVEMYSDDRPILNHVKYYACLGFYR
jgi:hypothetical protein